MGNRVYKKIPGDPDPVKRKYIVDTVGQLPVVLLVMDAGNDNSVVNSYVYVNSQVLAQYDGEQDSENDKHFYLHDRLGSVRLLIDESGDVKNTYLYEPFGSEVSSETTETVSNPYRFAGYLWDGETGEYYCNARMYDPFLMRFTSIDPVFGKLYQPLTLHKYLYCLNDPGNRIDPDGQDYVDINVTWTYGMVAGMIHGAAIGAGTTFNPVGIGIGAGVGMFVGGFGVTGGVMIERNEAHLYLGGSWSTNLAGGIDMAFSVAPCPDASAEQGWHIGVAGSLSGGYTQWSYNWNTGDAAMEFGMAGGTSMGYGVTTSIFYVFPGMQIPYLTDGGPRSAFSNLDLLDKAIMMNEMREDTGSLINSRALGVTIPGLKAKIAFLSMYGFTSDMLMGM